MKRLGLKDFWPRGPESWSRNEETNANIFLISLLFYIPPPGMLPPSPTLICFFFLSPVQRLPQSQRFPDSPAGRISHQNFHRPTCVSLWHWALPNLDVSYIFALHFCWLPYDYKNNSRLSLSWINPCVPPLQVWELCTVLCTVLNVGIP